MADMQQKTKHAVTLRGSAQIICEYLQFAANSIIFQRGIYPPGTFKADQKYGVPLWISDDPAIKTFLHNLLSQSEAWIVSKKITKMSLVIINVQTNEIMECWDFNLELEDGDSALTAENKELTGNKELKKIQLEIRDVMLQICATVSYLPLLDCRCTFDMLTHVKDDCELPEKWDVAKPIFIADSQNVKLKSFSTSVHKIETVVNYKMTQY